MQLGTHLFKLRTGVLQVACSSIIALGVSRIATSQDLPLAEPPEVGMSAAGLATMTTAIKRLIEDEEVAGTVAIVARRGKVVYFEAQGLQDVAARTPMARDTIFRIYSMTKAVVSVAAMILVEEGKLDLDLPAATYIPALRKMRVGGRPQERPMTLRDLLRHTAGFPNNVSTDLALKRGGYPALAESSLEESMNRLAVVPLRYQPGSGWHYSFATDVVARLIEVASGQAVDKFLDQRVFQPLGMVDTAFYCPHAKRRRLAVVYGRGLKPTVGPQPGTSGPFTFEKAPRFLSGGGGLVSTAGDYMRFCLMLLGYGAFSGKRLLEADTVEAMIRNQLPAAIGEISRQPEGRGFGLGFAVRVRKLPGDPAPLGEFEWIGGAGTEFFVAPSEDLAVITMSQQMPMYSLKTALRPLIYEAIVERGATNNRR